MADFNSYGARRGNHEVMMRGTFANVRIKNLMLPRHRRRPHAATRARSMPIYDAAMHYIADGTPTVVFGGEEYGTGSSRDWAAKGTQLLGVKAVIARSFERIHRSNLVGMGVLPLQFTGADSRRIARPQRRRDDRRRCGRRTSSRSRMSTLVITPLGRHEEGDHGADRASTPPIEVDYYRHGGILPFVLRELIRGAGKKARAA